jgi:hypothetical protein
MNFRATCHHQYIPGLSSVMQKASQDFVSSCFKQRKHDKTHKNLKHLKTVHHCPITFPTFEASPASQTVAEIRETLKPFDPATLGRHQPWRPALISTVSSSRSACVCDDQIDQQVA